ncbi:MAG: 2-amino-4-hydroxy-6-hydroxymethyldihydropteridine diphosphokinase [Dissulfurimicrobium sp.]
MAYIGLGANLRPRRKNCLLAIELLKKTPEIRVVSMSRFYETEPVGVDTTHLFVNAAAGIETSLLPYPLLDMLLQIEHKLGRDRSKGPDRTIDIDLLYYEGVKIDEGGLSLPHPRASGRRFVLAPLVEIAPDLNIGPEGETVAMLLSRLPEIPSVRMMDKGSRS